MSPRRRAALAAAALVAGLTAAVALAAAGGLLAGPEGIPDAPPGTASISDAAAFEPFALDEVSEDELLERARAGFSHPLYAFSPGGAPASAARTARFRAPLEAASGRHGIGPDTLEALVMLESAGRPDVAAGDDPEGAVGLGQILPGTATALLGMRVDLGASKRLSAAIERVRRRAERARSARTRRAATRRAAELARRRRAVDERYDPARSLDGAARYLAIAERRFGREDLALASYHMGMGNLERTVETYVAPARPAPRVRDTVAAHDVSYVRLYFASSPVDNARTHALLAGFGDDSRTYLFRLEAAREIMRLQRDDPVELARRARLHALWPSGELVLRPPAEADRYADANALRASYDEGELVPLP
ncbi:MAG TPA: transglycosylase SLT domain-containing protein, partial [Thermoleophilaceae bacterium]|nr:transglycosylase SLT domain-containing protein [Thermoleophilaceae bacterium]